MHRSLCLGILGLATAPLLAADPAWPQFRGPGGMGVADTETPPVKFGLTQNVQWKVPVPSGFSSPIVIGDKLGERVAATPAVADNTLYVRTAKQLIAFAEAK